jgi:hypothetical protein
MSRSAKTMRITTFLALVGISLALPARGWGGSCCGGGGGATLILPKTARTAASLTTAWEQYDGYYDQGGTWRPDPPGSDLAQYRLSLALAQRFGTDWQASVNLPYVWNRNRYAAVDSATDGLGDTSVAVTYETFSSPTCVTRITRLKDLAPSVYLSGGLLIPTGVSPYDEVNNSFDITGRGFYRADLNLLADKTIFPWTVTLSGGVGHHFERQVNREYGSYVEPYSKQLGNTANGALAVGYTWDLPWEVTTGMTLITTVSYSQRWEGEATIDGVKDESSGLRKRDMGISATVLSFGDDWAVNLGYVTSRPASGWGRNCPATDVFTLGVRHVLY